MQNAFAGSAIVSGCIAAIALATMVTAAPERQFERAPMPRQVAAAADVPEIVGYYSCSGTDAKNRYSGVVSIERQADTYLVRWTVGISGYMGVGVRQGNDLSVAWVISDKARGVTLFRIAPGKDGPTLTGRWVSAPGDGQMHDETLRWLKGPDRSEDAPAMPVIEDDD